jgi:hypothetical protein
MWAQQESECGRPELDVNSMIIVDERNGRTFNGALENRNSANIQGIGGHVHVSKSLETPKLRFYLKIKF